MKTSLTTVVILLTLVFSAGAMAQQKKAPNFVLKSSDGTTYELNKYKGKVVVVNFWATWCGPCRKEIPDFIEVYKKYEEKGLEIIGISLDRDGWAKVKPFVKANNISYPIVVDDANVAPSFGKIEFIPTTFIVDKNGNIVDEHVGGMSKTQLEAKLKPLL